MDGTRARGRGVLAIVVCAAAGVALLAGGVLARVHGQRAPVSTAEVEASVGRGVAWVWPGSNGPQRAGEVAVLVESLILRGHGVERSGRTQPLAVPADVRLVPVIHVEAADDAPAEISDRQRRAIVAAVQRHASLAGSGTLQLDFEAPTRQREAYRTLVATLRDALPTHVRLSVTALAHWCTQGDWLDRLPVDEVVPMLYRLGPHADDWRRRFTQGDPALARRCQGPALGFATNDPPSSALLARATRPYWFDEAAWANPSRPPRHIAP